MEVNNCKITVNYPLTCLGHRQHGPVWGDISVRSQIATGKNKMCNHREELPRKTNREDLRLDHSVLSLPHQSVPHPKSERMAPRLR